MQVAIIGTGNVGTALGASLVRSGHKVTFTARDARKARRAASDVGARAAASPQAAVTAADVVVLAIPYGAALEIADELAPVVRDKVVVDATNPLRPDLSGLATDADASGAERIAHRLAGARVVKAFNTLFATNQADPTAQGMTLDALLATDDDEAAGTVAELARTMGFRPVRVGPLAAARELEALAWMNIRLQMLAGGSWQTAYVLVGAPPAAIAA